MQSVIAQTVKPSSAIVGDRLQGFPLVGRLASLDESILQQDQRFSRAIGGDAMWGLRLGLPIVEVARRAAR